MDGKTTQRAWDSAGSRTYWEEIMRNSSRIAVTLAAGLTLSLAALSPTLAAGKPALAFVANRASDFWKAAEAGMKKAKAELPDYDLGFKYPDVASVANQQALMD